MKSKLILFLSLLLFVQISFATEINPGPVNGTWNLSGSPYNILGEINIPVDQSLTIEPGVEIIFQGHYKFTVYGKLLAIGTAADSISFTAENIEIGWYGMRFTDTSTNGQDNSILNHCIFEYGNALTGNEESNRGGALSCSYSSNVQIINCRFSNNQSDYGGAISLRYSDITIQDCLISYNYASHDGGGMVINDQSEPIISNTIIEHNSCFFNGGGIYCCNESSAILNNMIIRSNSTTCDDGVSEPSGGGIACWNANLEMNNVLVYENISFGYGKGGGVELRDGSVINFTDGIISNNQARFGGGICNFATINLSGVTISENIAETAGGIYQLGNIDFNTDNRCNIYLNNATNSNNTGNDIMTNYTNIEVIVDTFTVMTPTEYHTSPIEIFSFDILNFKVLTITNDLYVSPLGSDDNSGLTLDDPLLTIYQALQMISPDSLNHLTIHLAEGTYSQSSTGEIFPIQMVDYITLEGENRISTILDAEGTNHVIEIYGIEDSYIDNLSVTNGSLCGLYCNDSQITIQNVYSFDNHTGISLYECSEVNIINTIIAHNNSVGLYCNDTNPYLSSVSIFENSSSSSGGGAKFVSSTPVFDSENRCSIYLNTADYNGQDIYVYNSIVEVVLDTFTVIQPFEYFCSNLENYTFDIENAAVETVDSDIYVSPLGSDENSGLTADDPLKTISYAYLKVSENSQDPQTIFLADGIYSPSQTNEIFPIKCRSYVTLSGANKHTTILDSEQGNRLLSCYYSNVCIENFTVTNSSTSSIIIGRNQELVENLELNELIIKNNYSSGSGAGIYCHDCNPSFNNLIIQDNISGSRGGGIYLDDANPIMNNVTIKYNFADNKGGGLYCNSSVPTFSSDSRSNIYLNETSNGFSRDLYNYDATIDVIVDTFTVNFPDDYYAQPINNFNFDILHYMVEQIDQDVYVNPDGSDSNSGLSPDDPFQTISYALSRIVSNSTDPHTIHLADGIYSPSETGEIYPIHSKDHIIIEGENAENTILDGNNLTRIFVCTSDDFSLRKLTICNGNALVSYYYSYDGGGIYNSSDELELSDVIIRDNTAEDGGGLYCFFGSSILHNVVISNNSAINGGGIYSGLFSQLELQTVAITNNSCSSYGYGGGIYSTQDNETIIINSTISGNSAGSNGGGIYIEQTDGLLLNSICCDNTPDEIYLYGFNSNYSFAIDYSDIVGGESAIINDGYGEVNWLDHNIILDPQFIDAKTGNYYLQSESPCIDAGTAFYEWDNDIILNLGEDEYYGDAPDMGALEWDGTLVSDELEVMSYELGNFPNPFNPETKISFSIPEESNVELSIYNIKGQRVKSLIKEKYLEGDYSVVWDGRDSNNKRVGSGIYFYKLKAANYQKVKKMILLK